MILPPTLCRALRYLALVLGAAISHPSHSASTAARPLSSSIAECLGYYTVTLPNAFSYALAKNNDSRSSQFPEDGLGAWGTELRLHLTDLDEQELSVSPPAGPADLQALMDLLNERQARLRKDLLRKADLFAEPDLTRQDLIKEAEAVDFFKPARKGMAIGAVLGAEHLALHVLANGRILSTALKPRGSAESTLDAFLSHYKPRALGEVPDGPGVCVPYGFFTREKQPATIGLNIRLKDQPDIVVYLRASDAATDAPDDPRKLLDGLTPVATFFGSRIVVPTSRFKPLQAITIDGQEGLGSFVVVTRRTVADQSRAFNNAADGNQDWGYFAYVPGRSGGKPGESFNITFKVERFGRFAQRPMTEREFRDLTLRIAASIKRRPGAWVAP